jgi:Xaa-Pro aminopeptidase
MTLSPNTDPRIDRLQKLRAAMAAQGIDALVVPSSDPHLSEYLPARWKGREWLSGFSGSVGTFIATASFAGVWTDARYWAVAEAELAGAPIELMKIPSGASLQHIDWLAAKLQPGQVVAVDARVLGLSTARLLYGAMAARDIVVRTDIDLLDAVWDERPGLPPEPVYEHAAPYAPLPRAAKLAQVRAAMAALGANRHFISTLDDIAWLFNLRGADVSYNPVFLAHALLEPQGATLFVGAGKVPEALREQLAADGVQLAPYDEAAAALAALRAGTALLVDPRRITAGMREAVGKHVTVIEAVNPSTFAKSRKTEQEAAQVRATMEQDGAALCEFFAWLEPLLDDPQRAGLTELTIDREITAAGRAAPVLSAPASARSPASTPTARSCITRPPNAGMPPSRATACC